METIVNPFDVGGFDLVTLTNGINILPNNYGLLKSKNLFRTEGVTTRQIGIEEMHGVLNLLNTQPIGGPAPKSKSGKRKMRSFTIPHIPLADMIMPSEYQGVREFGGTGSETLTNVMTKHLQNMRNKHAITLEYLRMGALKGIILDADNSTIYNLYTEFGITQKLVDFALDTSTTDVAAKCREVLRHIEDNLKGEVMSGVECLCSSTFFDALIGHDNVEKFWLNHAKAVELTGGGRDPRKGFSFGGIIFIEYRATADDPDGNTRKFITDDEAHFYPVGTMDTFVNYFAPADTIHTVNTPGKELYASQELGKHGKYVDLHTESNPLPMCRRPGLLVKGTI